MKIDEQVYDITIIGGGPVGLYTAFYGGMRKASIKIIDSLPYLGGQLAALYPEKYIYDIAGLPKIRAQQLIDQLIEQMNIFKPTVCLNESVEFVGKQEEQLFKLVTNESIHYTKTIIIAAGNGAFTPRTLKVENAPYYENKNLHYFIDSMQQFSDKEVVICGGGDSAVDWALMLEPIAKKVTIVHRREKFRAHEHSVEKLKASTVEIKTPFIPVKLKGDADKIDAILLNEVRGMKKEVIPLDELIVNYGFISSIGPMKEWGFHIEKNAIKVDAKMETSIRGIFAAGDIATYDGKVKLISVGFGEAPIAVNHAKQLIDPKARLQPVHSTTLFA